MIIYNVTVKVNLEVHDVWLKWMREHHIPNVMSSGCFVKNKILRLMEDDQTDGITYAVQYYAESVADYFRYRDLHALKMQKEALETFPNQFVAFRTLMREVD